MNTIDSYKIGDIVKQCDNNNPSLFINWDLRYVGIHGKVVSLKAPSGKDLVGVEFFEQLESFDSGLLFGHNLNNILPKRNCYGRWYEPFELEIVTIKEPKFIADNKYQGLFE